jgi:nucleoside-diphosphate-sugar epimerase
MARKRYRSVVTGACSFLGSHLVETLSRGNHDVVATDESTALDARDGPLGLFGSRIRSFASEVQVSDLTAVGSLDSVVEGADFVFHAARSEPCVHNWKRRWQVDVQGTRNLVESVRRAAPRLRRLVYLGSAGIHGIGQAGYPINEDTPIHPPTDALRAVWFAEHLITDLCPKRDIPYAVLRPGNIYGPYLRDGIADLLRLASLPLVPLPEGKEPRVPLVHVDDVCLAADHVAKYSSGENGVFLVADDAALGVAEILRIMADAMGNRTVSVPGVHAGFFRNAMKGVADITAFVATHRGRLPRLDPDRLVFLDADRVLSNSRLRSAGYVLKHPDPTDSLRTMAREWITRQR